MSANSEPCPLCPTAGDVEKALATVNVLLHVDGAVTTRGDEIKCQLYDDDNGGTCKAYLTASDCRALSAAFATLAEKLGGGK